MAMQKVSVSTAAPPLPFSQPIQLTRPLVPTLAEYNKRLAAIWGASWLTNFGEQHRALEERLRTHLEVPYIALFSNGTAALISALRVLGLEGQVITTPFT